MIIGIGYILLVAFLVWLFNGPEPGPEFTPEQLGYVPFSDEDLLEIERQLVLRGDDV